MSRNGNRQEPSSDAPYESGAYGVVRDGVAVTGSFDGGPGDADDPRDTPPGAAGAHDAGPPRSGGHEDTGRPGSAEPPPPTPPPSGRVRRPDPEPLEADDVKIVGIGTVVWFVLFLVSLPFHDTLERNDREWWPWCALAGAGLGLLGLIYVHRRRNALRRRTGG